ncbi:MAG: hypothetical protein QM760_12565 [Nibricoccus sp.]
MPPAPQVRAVANEEAPASLPKVEPAPGSVDALRTLMEEKKNGKKVSIPVVNFLGKVDDKFTESFGLTKDQAGRVQAAIDAAVVVLGELELENATVVQRDAGKITVQIKAFPERGGQVYDALTKEIGEILGSEKKEAFAVLATEALDEGLGFFGTSEKTATLEWRPGAKSYALRETMEVRETVGATTSVRKKNSSIKLPPDLLRQIRPALAEIASASEASSPAK